MRSPVDQRRGQRLASQIADIHPIIFTNLDRVEAWGLTAHGMDPCGSDFDVLAISGQAPKKALRAGASTDISRTNKENAFHDARRANLRSPNLGLNEVKSTSATVSFEHCRSWRGGALAILERAAKVRECVRERSGFAIGWNGPVSSWRQN
jgi:hypothetical protein